MRVRVELTPERAQLHANVRGWPRDRRFWTAVAIDVLRATTSLTVALDRGARRIVPFTRIEDALALRASGPAVLACGERDGRIVPGFDLGNSPLEYASERVAGCTLAFASTNGSVALTAVADCGTRLLAAFVNATAVVERLAGRRFVLVVCAGKLGRFALEDAACAGWLCAALESRGAALDGAGARLAKSLAPRDAAEVREVTQASSHGRYLRRLGGEFARDVEFCGRLDALPRAFEW